MQPLSFRERFVGLPNPINGGRFAPSTIGAPVYTNTVDYSVFKKTAEDKLKEAEVRANYKKPETKMKPYARFST